MDIFQVRKSVIYFEINLYPVSANQFRLVKDQNGTLKSTMGTEEKGSQTNTILLVILIIIAIVILFWLMTQPNTPLTPQLRDVSKLIQAV